MIKGNGGWFLLFTSAAITASIDQASKLLALKLLPTEGFSLLPFLQLKLTPNYNSIFGIHFPLTALIIASLAVLALLLILYSKSLVKNTHLSLILGILIGAGFSNVLDRFARSHVVDFISVADLSVFNISDIAIIGSIIYLLAFGRKILEDNTSHRA